MGRSKPAAIARDVVTASVPGRILDAIRIWVRLS
jgi:hypothetical protein